MARHSRFVNAAIAVSCCSSGPHACTGRNFEITDTHFCILEAGLLYYTPLFRSEVLMGKTISIHVIRVALLEHYTCNVEFNLKSIISQAYFQASLLFPYGPMRLSRHLYRSHSA